jgi:hypothetical protein
MAIIPPGEVVEVGLVKEIVAVKIVKVTGKCEEHSSGDETKLHCESEGVLQFVLFGRVVLVHYQKRNQDYGKDSEVDPQSEYRVRNVFLEFVGLPLDYASVSPLKRTHVPVSLFSKIEVPKGKP